MVITSRASCRLSILVALVVATGACTSVAQVSNLAEPACGAEFEKQLSSILVQENEKSEVAASLASECRTALASRNRGPHPFLVSSSSGTDYTFFVQAKRSGCLLRLYGRQKGFMSYTNNLTYIATRILPACTCAE